jgi:hypothetical protein
MERAMQSRTVDLEGIDADGLGHSITISGPCSNTPARPPKLMVRVPKVRLPWRKKQQESDLEAVSQDKAENFWNIANPQVSKRESVKLQWEPRKNPAPQNLQHKEFFEPEFDVQAAVDKMNRKYGFVSTDSTAQDNIAEGADTATIDTAFSAATVALPDSDEASVVASFGTDEVNYTRYSTETEESFTANH